MSWPDGGTWVVATTSSSPSWALATAALCAASTARVAVLRIVHEDPDTPSELVRDNLASYLEVRAGAVDPIRLDDLVGLVQALTRTHGLVLVAGAPGLVVPLGHGGWTLADLAWALGAPVVLVADLGPDAANHATLALDVLAGRDLAGTVLAVGDGDQLAGLPVALAGRIPADAGNRPETFRAAAPGWLDPLLHASRGPTAAVSTTVPAPRPSADAGVEEPVGAGAERPADAGPTDPRGPGAAESSGPEAAESSGAEVPESAVSEPAVPESAVSEPAVPGAARKAPRTVSGKRVLLILVGVFVASALLLCTLNLVTSAGPVVVTEHRITATGIAPTGRLPVPIQTGGPAGLSARVCVKPAGVVTATVPDAATTARVDAAWRRIERWLARHAPRSLAGLRPAAQPAQVSQTQMLISVPFPPDLVASLLRHDGATDFDLPPFYQPLSLDRIVADSMVNCSMLDEPPADGDWWHRSFVPFAAAGDGGSLLVDQRSGGHGRVGEFYPETGTTFDGWPASVTELLEGVARSLETGTPYAARYRPTVDAQGRLDWTIERPSQPAVSGSRAAPATPR